MGLMLIGLSSLLEIDIFPFLFEALTKPLFQIISVFEGIFKGLAGIVDPVSSDIGLVENAAGSKNIIVQLFQSKTMQSILTSLMLFGIVVLVLSVILAIIRNVYKDDSKVTISSIIGQAIKAVIGFILVPSLCLVGVMLSNVILVAVDGATNARGTPSFAAGIYSACQKEDQDTIQNVFNDVINSEPVEYFGNINQSSSGDSSSGESTGSEESGNTTTDNTSVYDFHIAGIIYAQYLWQALTEDCIYNATGWLHRTANAGTANFENEKYIDVLGLKVKNDDILDFTDMNNWDNGNGIAGVIDTKEDVALFYEMLKNQYTANFPKAKKSSIVNKISLIKDKYPECRIAFASKTVYNSNNYFGAGSDTGDLRTKSFIYYYYGKALFDYNGDYGEVQQDEKYLKEAYIAFKESNTFDATSWTFKKDDSQWTNDNLNKTLCMANNINYFYAFVASIMVAKSLFVLCFGMAKRIVQLALYYVLSPIALALYPFDNGRTFGSWKSDFVGYTVGAFGAVAGVNLTIQLMPVVNRIQIFSSRIYNDVTQLILYIILAQGMEALVKTLSGWIGGKDLFAEGKATSQTATAPIKKVAGSVMKVAGTVIGTGVGVAIGASAARKNRTTLGELTKKMGGTAEDKQEAEETAKAAGYSSASAYKADLEKNSSNGKAWYLGGGLGTALKNTVKTKANQIGDFATNKFASTQFGMAFDKETGLSKLISKSAAQDASAKVKTDLEAKLDTDFKNGIVTAKMSADLTKALEDIKASLDKNSSTSAASMNATAVSAFAGQLAGIKGLTTDNAEEFIRTGNMSLINSLSGKAQQMAIQTRSNYLASDEYQDYSRNLRAARSYGLTEADINDAGFKAENVVNTIMSSITNNLDYAKFRTAQQTGNEQEMYRMMAASVAATTNISHSMIDQLTKGVASITTSAVDAIKKTQTETQTKVQQQTENRWKGSAPKK